MRPKTVEYSNPQGMKTHYSGLPVTVIMASILLAFSGCGDGNSSPQGKSIESHNELVLTKQEVFQRCVDSIQAGISGKESNQEKLEISKKMTEQICERLSETCVKNPTHGSCEFLKSTR